MLCSFIKPIWFGLIICSSMGYNLLANILAKSLYTDPNKIVGHHFFIKVLSPPLGSKHKIFVLKFLHRYPTESASLNTSNRSISITSHMHTKNFVGKPSPLGAFPFCRACRASLTSLRDKGCFSNSFFSW
jgi:hypothetical protein